MTTSSRSIRVSVPLHASGLPTPPVTATEASTGYDIAWTTDAPAASAIVDVTSGLSYGYVGDPFE